MSTYLAFDLPNYKGIYNPLGGPTGGLPGGGKNAWQTLQLLVDWGLKAFYIGIIVYSFMNLIMGGISWIQSEGDKEKLKKAQDKMKVAVIGFVMAMLIFAGIFTIQRMFGASFAQRCKPTDIYCWLMLVK